MPKPLAGAVLTVAQWPTHQIGNDLRRVKGGSIFGVAISVRAREIPFMGFEIPIYGLREFWPERAPSH